MTGWNQSGMKGKVGGFRNPGVCLQAFPSFPSPLFFHVVIPCPWTHGNACYAGYQTTGVFFHRVWEAVTINNGNRTEWSPVQSVIIQVINKIGRPLWKRWRWRESVKAAPVGSKVIFKWSPADLWSKVCSRDRDASKQRSTKARNVLLAPADVRGGEGLRDELKECLRRL